MAQQQKKSVMGSKNHKIRIVGGQWKRTPIAVVDVEGLRPTTDRVRETVFNWINHIYDNELSTLNCLDVFAGTGALGFEAASRGVNSVVCIEQNKQAWQALIKMQEKLQAKQISVQQADAIKMLERFVQAKKQFDLIFLDPPFKLSLLPHVFKLCEKLLSPHGLIYIEADFEVTDEVIANWCGNQQTLGIIRQGKAGQVFYHLCAHSDWLVA